MGTFNSFGAVSGQMSAKQEHLQIANALLEELKVPGKLAAILSSLRASEHAILLPRWIAGETSPVTASVVQQGLQQTTLIQNLESRTRMPGGVVKAGMAVLLPIAVCQLAQDGSVTAEGEAAGELPKNFDNLVKALR